MFRKKKDKKGDETDHLPNINDDDDAMWFNPKGSVSAGGGGAVPTPAMGVPPAPPNGLRMSVSPSLSGVRKSSENKTSERKRYSANDLVAAINFNDWGAVMKIISQDPKVAGKNAELTLKGQKTEGNALLSLVIANPPVEVVEKMIKANPSAANNTDRQGDRTALHWACIANASPDVLQAVVGANGSACRHQDKKFSRTPLHYLALIAQDPEQVQVLMDAERRASMIKDANQKTPLDLANDSSNPAKMDIVAALQRKRASTINMNMFGAFKSSTKSRGTSPGKYKPRESESMTAPHSPPKSPGKYTSSPGKYSSRKSTAGAPKSPGKHRERSSRGRRSEDGERSSRGHRRSVDGERDKSSSGHHRSSRSDRRESRRHRDSRSDAKAAQAAAAYGVSDDSGEFEPPPTTRLTQSVSLGSANISVPPSRSVSPEVSPSRSRSRSPKVSVSPPPPPIVPASPVFNSAPAMASAAVSAPDRTSTSSRPSSQSLTAGMDGEIVALRDKLERKKRAVETKDREIAQMDDQIQDIKDDVAALYEQAQDGAASSANGHKLSEKRDKVQRLKDKIAELQAELRRAEKDVQRLERNGGGGGAVDMAYIQDQIQTKEEERSSLVFVKEALEQEKMAAQREVENVESELKSLEAIQMLAQADSNIG